MAPESRSGCWAIILPIISSTRCFEPPCTPAKVRWGVSMCSICIVLFQVLPGIDALLAANIFFLVLDQLSIQTVGQQVNGGIHIGMFRFGNQVVAGDVQGTFGLLLQLVYLQSDLDADDLVEVPFEAGELFGYVITQSIGDI